MGFTKKASEPPFYADPCVLTEPDRNMVQYFYSGCASRRSMAEQAGIGRADYELYKKLQRALGQAVSMDIHW